MEAGADDCWWELSVDDGGGGGGLGGAAPDDGRAKLDWISFIKSSFSVFLANTKSVTLFWNLSNIGVKSL